VLDILDMTFLWKWLAASPATDLPDLYAGIKIPTNPAARLLAILDLNSNFKPF
jgi:hypothetical protein